MIDDLEREATPPPALKARVLRSLTARGLLRSRPTTRWRLVGQVAAAVVLFAAGALAGRRGAEPPAADAGPRWVLLLYEDAAFRPTKPEAALVAEYGEWAARLRGNHKLELGEKLGEGQRVLGPEGGPGSPPGTVTGVFIIRAATWDEAVTIGRTCPHARYGGRIVVRPIEPT
jgi:hypothetical protein